MNTNLRQKEQNNKSKSLRSERRRYSLAKIISGAFAAIAILFMISMALSYYRLMSFQSLFSHIRDDSFPEMTYSRNLNKQVNELLYLSHNLSHASNDVTLRVTKLDIESKIKNIQKQMREKESNLYLTTQLDVITEGFSNLSNLVKEKLDIEKLINVGQNRMYSFNEEMFRLSQKNGQEKNNRLASTDWTIAYSKIITLASKALISNRLQAVRQSLSQVKIQLEVLDNGLILLPKSKQKSARALVLQLKSLLIDKEGLLLLKVEQLRIDGRVIGRANFMINLLDDFSRVAEFKSYRINIELIKDTNTIIERATAEKNMMVLTSVLVMFFLLLVIYFIEKRFVERIVALNKNVLMRLKGGHIKADVLANDEISDLSEAFNFFADKIEEQKQILHALSLTDGLTGLANRRSLDQRLLYDLQIAIRKKWPVVVLLMDIDFFKKYNDLYGHVAGDECLKQISTALLLCKKRTTDFVARYGGEEFLFILPDTQADGAQKIADNIIFEVNALNILHEGSTIASHVTLSIGIASFDPNNPIDSEKLIEKADEALYKAKDSGKNCSYFSQ